MTNIEEVYQKKTQLEHVLDRPDTYIGSTDFQECEQWVYEKNRLVLKKIQYVPGLYKIFDEILVNAADNKQRDSSMSLLKVVIDEERNFISVWNNGKGIPVEIHPKEKVYIPSMIFGDMFTSSNYDDSKKRTTGGRNGVGANLCNIYSTFFEVETVHDGKYFKQIWRNNMSEKEEPIVKKTSQIDHTFVKFIPDLSRFGMKSLDDQIISLFKRRVCDMAGVMENVQVYLNKERVPINGFKDYVQFHDDNTTWFSQKTDRWEVFVGTSAEGFKQRSFVNSICTSKGGTHTTEVANQIISVVQEAVKKKKSTEMKPVHIKSHLTMFVNCLIENPQFDSQVKETLTLKASSFGSKCDVSSLAKTLIKKSNLIEMLFQWANYKENQEKNKKLNGKKSQKVKGVPKLEDANMAGTRFSNKCSLLLTEGDSAKTFAVSGLSVLGKKGRDFYGVFPLRGKLLNVREASHKQIMNNEEIGNLVKILGLKYNEKYTSVDSLRYGKIMIMTDQDQDGSHIKGLIINFIDTNWRELLSLGFVVQFVTPIIKISRNKTSLSFFTLQDFEKWKQSEKNARKYKIKYYKGLGTSTSLEAREYFSNFDKHLIKMTHSGKESDQAIEMAFAKKNVDKRKEWIMNFMNNPKPCLKYDKEVSFEDFVNKELVQFSTLDNFRSIPSIMDGLKPGQRKVLFTCLARNDKQEVKVAQLAGAVAEKSAYHHGEVSLMGTIVNLAQNFVGSNNINLLEPIGQFGTRQHPSGKDCAQPRYIFTKLTQESKIIFLQEDDAILENLSEENKLIEPRWYCPIIPMILVNGAEGIGTGFNTKIPKFNPMDIINNLLRKLSGEDFIPMTPWYRGFTGEIKEQGEGKFSVRGVFTLDGDMLEITELPVKTWTQTYKENVLEPMNGGKITEFSNYSTENKVHFKIRLSEKQLGKRDLIEHDFKLCTSISTLGMYAFDANSNLKHWSVDSIMEYFFNIRLEKYQKRKENKLLLLEMEMCKLENQARFILEKIEGSVVLENMEDDDLTQMLKSRKYKPIEKSYNYLLDMNLRSLTKNKKDQLVKMRDAKMGELEKLKAITPEQWWREDLYNLREILDI